ncbi:ZN593 [Hepatospora eriocheir]|uniref:ZN593 n=1 Tax=Hepatospora eriocheir TaxID=1081669 RepID=A0A1X0QH11_9MICR|nr:ZN593 [Hepatospora eriocheir]
MGRNCTKKKGKSRNTKRIQHGFIKRHGLRQIDLIKTIKYTEEELEEFRERDLNFLCEKCDRFFKDENTLNVHYKTKSHKKRLKQWNEPFHTQEDAERAAGLF